MRSFHIVPRVAAASATQKASHDCVLPGLPGGSEAWTAAQLRIMHDLASIDLPPALATCVPVEGTAMYEQRVTITIPRGEGAVYGGGRFTFGLKFKPAYPFEAPRVTCLSRTFHPNINAAGSVCLNILRLDWSPILTIQSVILGLILLLSEPDGEEPLNHEAGRLLAEDPGAFARAVATTMAGGAYNGVIYDNVLQWGEPNTMAK